MNESELVNQFVHSKTNLLALEIILKKRIEELKEEMTTAPVDKVLGIQRAVFELKRLILIKDIVESKRG